MNKKQGHIQFNIQDRIRDAFFLFALKEDFDKEEYQKELKDLRIPDEVMGYHSSRKNEYILGRILLKKAFFSYFSLVVNEFVVDESRRVLPPAGYSLSLSHDAEQVVVVVSNINISLGIDLEKIGRIKPEMESYILSTADNVEALMLQSQLSRDEVLALVFSAKESLYKVLFPFIGKYFGFDAAYVKSIDPNLSTFEIVLTRRLDGKSLFFENGFSLQGIFQVSEDKLLTFLQFN